MTEQPRILMETDARGVATVTLNRADKNNAYDGTMVEALHAGAAQLANDDAVRVVVLRGAGRYFQAGADLNWITEVSDGPADISRKMTQLTAEAMARLDACPKPTIALVHGACFGGGTGIIASCDVVIASEEAIFSIAEVRWGLSPAVIMPQLAASMGVGNARRYAISAERFDAAKAKEMGLVHEVCATGALDEAAAPIIDAFLMNGPEAMAETKAMLRAAAIGTATEGPDMDALVAAGAARRQGAEAKEGLASFREKRNPAWYPVIED